MSNYFTRPDNTVFRANSWSKEWAEEALAHMRITYRGFYQGYDVETVNNPSELELPKRFEDHEIYIYTHYYGINPHFEPGQLRVKATVSKTGKESYELVKLEVIIPNEERDDVYPFEAQPTANNQFAVRAL